MQQSCEIVHGPHRWTLGSTFDVADVAQTVAGGDRKIHLGEAALFSPRQQGLSECLLETA